MAVRIAPDAKTRDRVSAIEVLAAILTIDNFYNYTNPQLYDTFEIVPHLPLTLFSHSFQTSLLLDFTAKQSAPHPFAGRK